ncbi:lyase family protein, partial [Ideonella sp.]|uniref:lyase family protein n=1 Tax=Ideonella sp. TaxID=1929293 RepID=UPI003BB77BE8
MTIHDAPAPRWAHDDFGPIAVPADVLWGAQTARSLQFFAIGAQPMPLAMIHAMAWVKWAAARVNAQLGRLPAERARAIAQAARRVARGGHDTEFPLSVWQTGSGTQSHMNVNEVLASLATQALQATAGGADVVPVDAHDEVNLGQSSNDVFPTAMHLALALAMRARLLPALQSLQTELLRHAQGFAGLVKVGRTHGQDATPVTLGQEFGGYAAQLALCEAALRQALPAVHALALGGTAVGTGLNTPADFGPRCAALLGRHFGLPLRQADNLFAALAGHEAVVALHASLRMLAIALIKIGNDIRWMGSGPRAGLGELRLPANEPGSS